MAPIKTNNPYASYFDFFSRSGTDAVTPEPPPFDFTINGASKYLPTGWDSGLNAGPYTMVIGSSPITVTIKLWGGGGGSGTYFGQGGGGGYTTATSTLTAGQTYTIVVGRGGNGDSTIPSPNPSPNAPLPTSYGGGGGADNIRGGGGGFSAIFSGSVAFANVGLLAGGAGGGGAAPNYTAPTGPSVAGGGGGGSNGANAIGPSPQATGGTPSALGTGSPSGTPAGGQLLGMTGRGGGGGGYYGGGAGSDNGSASPGGGGGSAYIGGHPNIPVSGASTTQGATAPGQAANNTDPYWGNAGLGAGPNTPIGNPGSGTNGNSGRVVVYN